MSEMKHTPGPWLPSRTTMKHLNIVQVGKTFRCSVVGDDNGSIVATVHGRTERECEANARLIAAAPDLLENGRAFLKAVEALCDWMNGNEIAADHKAAKPDDFNRLCETMVSFRSSIASAESLPLSKGQEEGK